MKIVVDANIVIAALIKESKVREIITNNEFTFVTPEFILNEVRKYENIIRKKASLSEEGFELVLSLLFETINIIPKEEYNTFLERAEEMMAEDIDDTPYVAVYLALKCAGIWTNDKHFKDKGIRIFTTQDLLNSKY
jgi:predicted nucleic acid-binding protein